MSGNSLKDGARAILPHMSLSERREQLAQELRSIADVVDQAEGLLCNLKQRMHLRPREIVRHRALVLETTDVKRDLRDLIGELQARMDIVGTDVDDLASASALPVKTSLSKYPPGLQPHHNISRWRGCWAVWVRRGRRRIATSFPLDTPVEVMQAWQRSVPKNASRSFAKKRLW